MRQSRISLFDRKEAELRTALLEYLPIVASKQTTFFFYTGRYNPWPGIKSLHESPIARSILALADEISAIAEEAGLSEFPSLAKETLYAFAQATDIKNPHKPSEARVAQELLKRVQIGGHSA